MGMHPATLMMRVWIFVVAAFVLLPFHLVGRTLSFYGGVMLALLIATFCVGSWLTSPHMQRLPYAPNVAIDFRMTDRLLQIASALATILFTVELLRGNYGDLAAAYNERSDRVTATLSGTGEGGGIFFQIAFLLYPAAYAYLVRQVGFAPRISVIRVLGFGILPLVAGSLVLGGRAPLAIGIFIAFLAIGLRRQLYPPVRTSSGRPGRNLGIYAALGVVMLVALNYFAKVFFVRAGGADNVGAAFDNAAYNWGVTFEGPYADVLRTILGEGNLYLLFVFVWYLVQGLVISNVIFTDYAGPPHFGVYGVDLVTAAMRRLAPAFVADRFQQLLDLNVYGFLPTAFGTAFVDFRYFCFVFIFIWGLLAGLVYRRTRDGRDPRWLLMAPFVTLGIGFSSVNTPIGFSNGLVTHIWMLIAFFSARTLFLSVPATVERYVEQPSRVT